MLRGIQHKSSMLLLLFTLLLLRGTNSVSQEHDIADLHERASTIEISLPDVPLDSLITIMYQVADTSMAEGMAWGRAIQQKAREQNDTMGIADCWTARGNIEYEHYHLDSALAFYERAMPLYEIAGTSEDRAYIYNLIGIVNDDLGRYSLSLLNYNKALREYMDRQDTAGLIMILNNIGITHENLGNFQQSLDFHSECLSYSEALDDTLSQAGALVNIGALYAGWGNYSLSLDNYLKALGYYIVLGEKDNEAWVLNHLGNLYLDWKNYGLSAQYYVQALRIYRELGSRVGEAKILNNLAIVYHEVEEMDTALAYYEASLELERKHGDVKGIAQSMENIGGLYMDLEDYDRALEYFDNARKYYEGLESVNGMAGVYSYLGEVYSITGKLKRAEDYFNKSMELARRIGSSNLLMELYKGLAKLHERQGDYRESVRYFHKYDTIRDSVFSSATEKRMLDLYNSYENARKRQEIELLNRENELRKRELQEKRDKIRQQNITMFIVTGIVLVLLVFTGLLYRQSSQRRKVNYQLEKKNREILQSRMELLRAKEKAEEADRLKTAFLANMSHEIRTPMNAIIGFTDLLKDPIYEADQQQEFIRLISENSEHLMGLIEDILDTARLESGQLKVMPREVNLTALLQDVYSSFRETVKEKTDLDFRLDMPKEGEELIAKTDPVRFRQVVNNLLHNATKFTEKGTISFGYSMDHGAGKAPVFFISDTGIGIPREKQDYIFKRFLQVDNSHTRKYGGSGLGLSISRGLVELMGGHIWLESEPGKGTTFYFTIDPELQEAEG